MTTIAANRREMAADSCTSWDSEFFLSSDKIQIIGKSIVGVSGHTPSIAKFLQWFRAGKGVDVPEFPEDDEKSFVALELNESGLFVYADACVGQPLVDAFAAIGSGGSAAKAALICGKSPRQAVEIAADCDKNTRPPIQRVTLAQALRHANKVGA